MSQIATGVTMKRRTNVEFTQIHVSIPVHVKQEFDNTLRFNQSRSQKISKLMLDYARNDGNPLDDYSRREILEHLQYMYDKDSPEDVLIQALLALH